MFAALLGRLLPFQWYATLAAFAALSVFAGWKAVAADRLELRLQAATARQGELQARIDTQNEGMRLVQRASEATAERSRQAAVAAQKALSQAEARAAKLMAKPAPQTCQEALNFLAEDARTP
jgi:hypothetical protein